MNDEIVIYPFPVDLSEAIKILRAEDWITSVYLHVPDDVIYNPANYLFNRQKANIRYRLVIDRNILSFVVNAVHKMPNLKPKHRAALALVCFCGYAEIQFDATVAVYERANYKAENVDQALSELELFFRVDDTPDMDGLLSCAVGKQDSFELKIGPTAEGTIASLRRWFQEYSRLKEWDPLYLFVMKLVDLSYENKSSEDKFRCFVLWCHAEFRYSMVATFYAFIFFSTRRFAKMMKYNKGQSVEERREAIVNMTWDLFTMTYLIRQLQSKKQNEEVFFASDDKVVRQLMKLILKTSDDASLEKLAEELGQENRALINAYREISTSTMEREFRGNLFRTPDQRLKLIAEYEKRVY